MVIIFHQSVSNIYIHWFGKLHFEISNTSKNVE